MAMVDCLAMVDAACGYAHLRPFAMEGKIDEGEGGEDEGMRKVSKR